MLAITLTLSLMICTEVVLADILDMPPAQSSNTGIAMPVRGQTMDEVRQQFGEPLQALRPIGNPPITRWKYTEYTVVFEGNYVIDSVQHRDLPRSNQ